MLNIYWFPSKGFQFLVIIILSEDFLNMNLSGFIRNIYEISLNSINILYI